MKLIAESRSIFERIGTASWIEASFHAESAMAAAKSRIGEADFRRLWGEGDAMSLSETVELANSAISEQAGSPA